MIFDHIVLVVDDLDSASRHFNQLGFTVIPGGEHPDLGTHNTLIGLKEGSYLVLFPSDNKMAMRNRAASPQSLSLRTSTGSNLLNLRFSQEQGYHLLSA